MSSTWTNLFPPKAKWSASQIPDLSGKVIIVTGGSGGLGKETAKILLNKNASVYIAARNAKGGEDAIKELQKATGKTAVFLKVDLADLKSVKAAAEEFKSKETKLDVLFNNGGVMFPPWESVTADGYDLQFGTNVLGHFYLTKLLIPELLAGAQSSPDGKSRVVNTSSMGHQLFYPQLNFDTFKDGAARKKLDNKKLYGQSKFGNVVVSNELDRRYGSQGIVSIALHPGNIKTDLARHSSGVEKAMTGWMLYPVDLGVLTQLYAGTSPEGSQLGGKYLIPWARVGKAHKGTDDPEVGKKLWEWLDAQVKDL
ncbi:NAD-P-binding protein [Mycena albidolilacea]|uniref:NAD-P-binding protein n=1 Tax=Mycena albidolilacea TaxID=1033008 RepID=A0AAD6ZG64_9AGAR|nr:NAD-P-binding protein [Mycena albidolilacea]